MRKTIFVVAFLFAAAWINSAPAEDATNSWDSLKQLEAGQKIQIVEKSLKDHQGAFIGYSADTISVEQKGERINCQRENILRVSSRGPSKRARNTLLGVAIGAGGGALVGWVIGANQAEEGEEGLYALVYAPIGAGIGAAWGATLPAYDYRVIYRATSSVTNK